MGEGCRLGVEPLDGRSYIVLPLGVDFCPFFLREEVDLRCGTGVLFDSR